MKAILYTFNIILLAFSVQSCSFNTVKGSGVVTEQEVPISDYNAIKFGGGASLIYEQNTEASPYLKIEIDDNLFPLLEIGSENGILSIRNKERENISPTKYNIYTNSTGLESLSASGSIKAHMKGKLTSNNLKIKVSGSGNITGDSIVCNSIMFRVSGSGNINLTGKTGLIDSSISGSGKIEALNMVADTAFCSVSGSGNFFVHANKYLKVDVSGSGNVKYKGEPKIDKSISGSGKVISLN